MEKHRCKLCLKSFANGRALGGHMRSHMLNLPIPTKVVEEEEERPNQQRPSEEESEAASASSSPCSSEEEKGQFYGLRDNPKRTIRLVDPEFVDAASVVLQDRESETESSKNPTHRRRSKRARKILDHRHHHQYHHPQQHQKQEEETAKLKVDNNQLISKTESWAEPEPVSSISDTTTEEDVAFCLMMLSRDQWKSKVHIQGEDDDDDEEEMEIEKSMEETDESAEECFKMTSSKVNRATRGKYRCETCNKVFKSYQALGGHRASHKKIKPHSSATHETELETENVMTEKKIHECPVCFRVFSSGQALGGHKRSHVTAQVVTTNETTTAPVRSSKKLGDSLIDLNLPAPMEDDDVSQIELSAVSDAEFVNHIKR